MMPTMRECAYNAMVAAKMPRTAATAMMRTTVIADLMRLFNEASDGAYLRFITWAPSAGLASAAGAPIACAGFVAVLAAVAGTIVACDAEFVRSGG